jgi:type IV secretory pathway TraG/TraD family ATPase VirD4
MLDWIDKISACASVLMAAAIAFGVFALVYDQRRKHKRAAVKFASAARAHGVIFGRKGGRLAYSPEDAEGHIGVFSASGTGKTAAVGIPTLRSWQGTSFVVDISGDICRNCPQMPNKMVFEPDNSASLPYNIFSVIDTLNCAEDQQEALEQLAFLLMPEPPQITENAKFFLTNGRKILTSALIAFYAQGLDFIEICEKIVSSSWIDLFRAIDKTGNAAARMYINSFEGANEQNSSGCKQSCDDAIKLFATNGHIKRSIRRPMSAETAVEPRKIEENNLFVLITEDKLSLYSPLLNIISSQMMQYIGTRQISTNSPTILLFLDEFGSLKIDADLVLDAVRRFRKRKCRLMLLTQNTVDMELLYGKAATRAILSNLCFKALLGGLGEPESQKYFAELIGYTIAKRKSTTSSNTNVSQTKAESREWLIEPAALDRQGKNTLLLLSSDFEHGYIKLKKNFYFNNKR